MLSLANTLTLLVFVLTTAVGLSDVHDVAGPDDCSLDA